MIKDKITPELKKRFLDEIRLSGERNKERGFLLCLDRKGKLFPSEPCEGSKCTIPWSHLRVTNPCPEKEQGDFHTHPMKDVMSKDVVGNIYKNYENILPHEYIRRRLQSRAEKLIKIDCEKVGVKGIPFSVQTPSYSDVLEALMSKCARLSEGTVCIGTDLDENHLECWTPKEIKEKDYSKICGKVLKEYRHKEKVKKELRKKLRVLSVKN